MQFEEKTQKQIKDRKEIVELWLRMFEIDNPMDVALLIIFSSFMQELYNEMVELDASEMPLITGTDIMRITINLLRKEILKIEHSISLGKEPKMRQ